MGWMAMALVGCGGAVECEEGWTLREDGSCAWVAEGQGAPDLQRFLDVQDCPPLTVDDEVLDLEAFCVGATCVGDDRPAFEAAWGPPSSDYGSVLFWDDPDMLVSFDDADASGTADKGEASHSLGLYSYGVPFSGTDANGLGLGVPLSCWLVHVGTPLQLEVVRQPDGWSLGRLMYASSAGYTFVSAGGVPGIADGISFYGGF